MSTIFNAASHVATPVQLAAFSLACVLALVYAARKQTGKISDRIRTLFLVAISGCLLIGFTAMMGDFYLRHQAGLSLLYRVRVTVVGADHMPVEDAVVWSSIGGEPKKVNGGWEFDIPNESKPLDGRIIVYAKITDSSQKGETNLHLDADRSPSIVVPLESDESAMVRGFVEDDSGHAISGVDVSVIGYGDERVTTSAHCGRTLLMARQSDYTPRLQNMNPLTRTSPLAHYPRFLSCTVNMARSSKVVCAFTIAAVLFVMPALAEDGTLVVHVIDIHNQPVAGISLRAGAGSSVGRVDSFGQARIRLAPNTRPGDIAFLELVAPQRDLVFISPLNRWTAVPSFDEKPSNFVEVVLVRRGDRAMLENGAAVKAIASEIVQKAALKSSGGQDALGEVAREYGRSPAEVDLAIRNWGKETTDKLERGLSEMYARQYPQAERDLRDSLHEQEKVEKDAKIKVAEGAALLGGVLRAQGKYDEAIVAYKEAVDFSPTNGTYLFGLAFTMLDNNDSREAESLGAKALALDQQRFGDISLDLASSYYKAGTIFVNQHKYTQAEPYFRRTVTLIEASAGPESPQLIRPLDNLALICSALGRASDSEELIKRAQKIQQISLSPDDFGNIYTSNKLADAYMAEGRYRDAAVLLYD